MPFGYTSHPSSTQPSPRSRRDRPLPFVTMPPPQSFYSNFDQSSRPHSPSYYRTTVADVQSTLYGGKERSRREITQFVEECYDSNATFDNPLTLATGHSSIAEMFSLLHVVPGSMFSELGDIAESQSYDGNRLVVMQHVLHVQFLPFLDPSHSHLAGSPSSGHLHRSHSFFSLPATPHPQNTPPVTTGIFSKTRSAGQGNLSPIGQIVASLSPRNLAVTLTTMHLRLHTRLLFNEHGKIIRHEDTWGLKELVEGVFPIVGHVYELQRRGLGVLASVTARTIFGFSRNVDDGDDDDRRRTLTARHDDLGRAGMMTPESCPLDDEGTHDYSHFYAPGSPVPTRKSSISAGVGPNTNNNALGMHHHHHHHHHHSHHSKRAAAAAMDHGLGLEHEGVHFEASGGVSSAGLANRLDRMSPERPTTIDSD